MKPISCFPAEAFDTWADVYDSQPNPLLALEQRLLGPMLPDVRGLDVLDAGCGTGRWLHHLADPVSKKLARRRHLLADAAAGSGQTRPRL